MSTDLTPYRSASLDEKRKYVQTIASAGELLPKGLWANVKNPETGLMENKPSPGKVMLVVETGVMLGLHPMAALRGIDIIEGNPTLKPALMSALIRDAGHVLRIEQTGSVEGGDLAVTTTGIRSDDPDHPYVYTWTPFDALRAGLIDSYAPDANGVWQVRARSDKGGIKPWEAYTARMCRWRSLGDTASAGFEDVLMGMHFTPEELGADVNEAGEMVQISETPKPTRDWVAELRGLTSKQAINDLVRAAREAGEYSDDVRTVALTRLGTIGRQEIEAPAPSEEPPADPATGDLTDEEYERAASAEFAAAVERGEVHP
ncbi:hypothetical protein [Kitasatospora herbaricolor]|uniref:hypothetical protein n=1 Tax=Kitasatospora herbaricolor TaxID=68217 RepID=UPI0036DAE79E